MLTEGDNINVRERIPARVWEEESPVAVESENGATT